MGSRLISDANATIREKIAALEKQRHGMSYGSIDYPRITAEIRSLAAQLQPEPSPEPSFKAHFKSFIVGVLVAVVSALILYFIFQIK
jgi:hypothetical protein